MKRPVRSLLVMLSLFAGAVAPGLQGQGISTVSPFLPQGGSAGVATENSPLELRGMLTDKDGSLYGLFDPVKRQGAWVRINEAGRDFLVRSFDESSDTAIVEYQGRVLNLVMKAPKIESMVPGRMQITGAPMPTNQPPPANVGAAQADEARRLELVTAEVRRRRAARQAAAQQPTPPPAAPGAAPQAR